jgi:YVTN family beta-propeller protein
MSARWRHEHRRALRLLVAAGASLALLAGAGGVALAATSGGGSPFGDEQVGGTYANGILLPTQQWIKPIGTRVLVDHDGRLLSSSISPNGQYLAALTWNDFTGWLTIISVKTGQVIQQIGTGAGSDKVIGDGTVAADGPLWSADGKSLWFPQTSDLVHFTVAPDGTVSSPAVIPLSTTIVNLTTGDTTVPDGPSGMALSPDGSKLYVALNVVNQLGVINTATNQLTKVIKVGNAPRQVVLAGRDAFVTNEGGRPAKLGEYTNNSAGTSIVANKVTGAASTGTVSEVSLATGKQVKSIRVGLEPSAEYLAPDGTLMVANSNNDSISLINTKTAAVEQTVNVNPLPGTTVGSNPNAITMPNASTVLVSIGRDNALAVYGYSGPRTPLRYQGLLPTDFYPVNAQYDPGRRQDRGDQRQGHRGPRHGQDHRQGSRDRPGRRVGHRPQHLQRYRLGHRVQHADPGQAGQLHPPGVRQQQLGAPAGQHAAAKLRGGGGGRPGPARLPVHHQARLPDRPGEPHLRPGFW